MKKHEVLITIRFTEDVEFKKGDIRQYSDALHYTQAEYSKLKEKDIEDEKLRRVNNWKNVVQNPAPYVEPTKEQYEEMLSSQEDQVKELKGKMIAKGYITLAADARVE